MKAFAPCFLVVCLCLAPVTHARCFVDGKIAYLQAGRDGPQGSFAGSVRFVERPGADQFRQLEDLGVRFIDHGKGRLGSRTVYPVRIPYAALDRLAELDCLAAVECDLRLAALPKLYNTRPEVEADLAWQVPSPLGGTLTGKGVTICDLDTGINYYHPMFFQLSENQYAWLDCDGSGALSDGDAVDLNGNGVADAGESLRYIEAMSQGKAYLEETFPNDQTRFNTDFDFLYNDANDDGERNYGAPHFTDTDPCFGELLFLVNDADGDRLLDPGESLQALGESKVRAIYSNMNGVFTRGVDLLSAELDTYNHGTPASGIMAGGWAGRHAMSGVAPGAELLHADLLCYGVEMMGEADNWTQSYMEKTAWAVSEGADIVHDEFGGWVWEFLDGSSNPEIMINEYAADEGVIFVIPNGDLAGQTLNSYFGSAGGQVLRVAPSTLQLYISLLWTADAELALQLTPPGELPVAIPGDGTILRPGHYQIYSKLSLSPRGTRRLDLKLSSGSGVDALAGDWVFAFTGPPTQVHGYFIDDEFDWASDSTWLNGLTEYYTMTHAATADSAINVGVYCNFNHFENGVLFPPGDIAPYSSTGPRIDEERINDLAAPGLLLVAPFYDIDECEFGFFLGTSAAGPFVAGAAALMKELVPDLDNGSCRKYLREGAEKTEFYTDPEHWGAGALRIHAALAPLLADKAAQPPAHPELQLAAYPNPFNPETRIRCYLAEEGPARLRIFAVDGREVWSTVLAPGDAGWREVTWQGRDESGQRVASGVYFAHVKQGERYMVGKLTLVK